MTDRPLRRTGNGFEGTVVGARGGRTREQILAEALKRFDTSGFHQTSMQDIAEGVGISRAALYQYFESKERILLDLIEGWAAATAALARRLQALGPTAEGFSSLRSWVNEWGRLYDRYAMLFTVALDWSDELVRPRISTFVTRLNAGIGATLAQAGVTGIDPVQASIVLTSVILRFNHLPVWGGRGRPDAEQGYQMAVLLQQMLFPSTPAEATRPRPDEPAQWAHRCVDGPSPSRRRRVGPATPYWARFEGLSARGASTVRALMRSGSRIFVEKGYHAAGVDEIAADAGYSRGTFYKYFADKLELLIALSDDCSEDLTADARRFARIAPGPECGTQLRQWVRSAFVLYGEHRGVYRTWLEVPPLHPEIVGHRDRVVDTMRRALHTSLGGVPRAHPIDLRVSHIFLVALVEEIPMAFRLNGLQPKQDPLTELLATILERTLFNTHGCPS